MPFRRADAPRRFLVRLAAATFISVLATAAVILAVFDRTNELYLLEIDRLLHDDSILWGPLFQQDVAIWHLNRAAIKHPDVMVVGSSRVTQFRDAMLPGTHFYNASLSASSPWDAEAYFRTLYTVHKPKLALLGIDSWWFDATRDPKFPPRATLSWHFSPTEQVAALLRQANDIRALGEMITTRLDLAPDPIGRRVPVGYNAAAKASGFRADGSYQYGAILLDRYPLYDRAGMGFRNGFRHERAQVQGTVGRFGYAGPPSQLAAETLRRIVHFHRDAGVELVLFFPPFAHAVYAEIQANPAQRKYFDEITRLVRQIAAEENVEFHDFHDYAKLGAEDSQTIDGLHVDEIGALAQLRTMVAAKGALARVITPEARRAMDALVATRHTINKHLVAP